MIYCPQTLIAYDRERIQAHKLVADVTFPSHILFSAYFVESFVFFNVVVLDVLISCRFLVVECDKLKHLKSSYTFNFVIIYV